MNIWPTITSTDIQRKYTWFFNQQLDFIDPCSKPNYSYMQIAMPFGTKSGQTSLSQQRESKQSKSIKHPTPVRVLPKRHLAREGSFVSPMFAITFVLHALSRNLQGNGFSVNLDSFLAIFFFLLTFVIYNFLF